MKKIQDKFKEVVDIYNNLLDTYQDKLVGTQDINGMMTIRDRICYQQNKMVDILHDARMDYVNARIQSEANQNKEYLLNIAKDIPITTAREKAKESNMQQSAELLFAEAFCKAVRDKKDAIKVMESSVSQRISNLKLELRNDI